MPSYPAKLFLPYNPGSNQPSTPADQTGEIASRQVAWILRGAMKTLLLILSLVFVLTGCNRAGSQESQAAAYCQKNGGIVETRYPYYDTNTQNPLRLQGSLTVCTFKANDLSHISIDVETLYTDQPTLAALAYLTTPRVEAVASPSDYCSKLGGSDRFGRVNDVGGGWGNQNGSDVLFLCIFPDLSVIDSQGLADHAAGFVKGANLAPLLRYKLDQSRKPFQ